MDVTNLTDHFLIAMPGLQDPYFSKTVTYICDHSAAGALGIVINRPIPQLFLDQILREMYMDVALDAPLEQSIFSGGPEKTEQGFILHIPVGEWDSSLKVTDSIGLTTSKDILAAIARKEIDHSLIALGYAGWGKGQLEKEMAENSWLSLPANTNILFDIPPESRWEAAVQLLGIDIHLLSSHVGHA